MGSVNIGGISVTQHLDVGPMVPGGEAVCRAVLKKGMARPLGHRTV